MSTKHSRPEKDTDCTDPRPPSILLGIDSDGDSHHHSTTQELIIAVEPDGTLANVVDIEAERRERDTDSIVDEYVCYVADMEGWTKTWYDASFGDLLAEVQ